MVETGLLANCLVRNIVGHEDWGYSPRESIGSYVLHPGQWKPAVTEGICHGKGRTSRNIACRQPFDPHFTSPTGGAYGCFSLKLEMNH